MDETRYRCTHCQWSGASESSAPFVECPHCRADVIPYEPLLALAWGAVRAFFRAPVSAASGAAAKQARPHRPRDAFDIGEGARSREVRPEAAL